MGAQPPDSIQGMDECCATRNLLQIITSCKLVRDKTIILILPPPVKEDSVPHMNSTPLWEEFDSCLLFIWWVSPATTCMTLIYYESDLLWHMRVQTGSSGAQMFHLQEGLWECTNGIKLVPFVLYVQNCFGHSGLALCVSVHLQKHLFPERQDDFKWVSEGPHDTRISFER